MAPRGVAALVDGYKVPLALYRRELGIYRVTLTGTPGAAHEPLAEERALRQAIALTLIAREAARRALHAAPAAIDAELAHMRAEAGGALALAALARAEGLNRSDLREMARSAVLDDLLLRRSHDPHLIDRLYDRARVTPFVGPNAAHPAAGPAPAPLPGHPAPAVAAQTIDGRSVMLAGLRGHAVLLNLWSTTCTWCREEMRLLDRFAQANPAISVIALDLGDTPAQAAAYARRVAPHLIVWTDPAAVTADSYGLVGLPDTFAIDRDGVVRAVTIGALDGAGTLRRDAAAVGV